VPFSTHPLVYSLIAAATAAAAVSWLWC